MADFSPTATQLAAPQGAGSAPVAPVQEQAVNESAISVLASAGNLIGRGIAEMVKPAAGNTATDWWIGEQSKLNDVMAKDPSKASEVAVRSRSLYQQAVSMASATGGAKGVTALANARQQFIAGTEMGQAEETVKTAADMRKDEIKSANTAGFEIDPSGAKPVVDAQLKQFRQYKSMITNLDLMGKQLDVEKKQTDAEKEKMARQSHGMMTDYSLTVTESRFAQARDLRSKIDQGGNPVEIMAQYEQLAVKDNQTLLVLEGMNKGAADEFRKYLTQVHTLGKDFLSGTKRAEVFDGEAKSLINQQTVIGMQNPEMARRASAMRLFPNVVLSNDSIAPVMNWIDGKAARVVGTDSEPAVTKTTKSMLEDVGKGNKELIPHANRVINGYFQDIGDRVSANDPKTLSEAAALMASTSYGQFRASGNAQIDPNASNTAVRVMQDSYEKPVKKQVETMISTALSQPKALPAAGVMKRDITDPNSNALTAPRIDSKNLTIKFSGDGIIWDVKQLPTDPADRRDALATIQELQKTEKAINQLIRMNAHNNNSTDYAKDWEENKSKYLPSVYTQPGAKTVDGKWEYIGKGEPFDRSDKANWRAIPAK